MKVLLYFGKYKTIQKSGIGRALKHQMEALDLNGVSYTLNPNDKFDIAHINTYFPDAKRVVKKLIKKKIPIVMHGHSTIEDFKDSFICSNLVAKTWYNKNLLWFYKQANYIVTPTNYSKGLIDAYNIGTPVEVVSNGIKKEDYLKKEENINAFKKRFNITDEKVIMSAGFYFKRKGIIDFFEIARKRPELKFVWFGYLSKSLRSNAVRVAIRNKPNNVYLPGYVPSEVIKGCYSYASAFLFPTYEENEGIVVLEALAASCPVLIRDIGVYKGWMKDKYNCYKAKNNEEFLKNIDLVINNDNSFMIKNGLSTIKDLSLDKIGESLKNVYEKVLKMSKN